MVCLVGRGPDQPNQHNHTNATRAHTHTHTHRPTSAPAATSVLAAAEAKADAAARAHHAAAASPAPPQQAPLLRTLRSATRGQAKALEEAISGKSTAVLHSQRVVYGGI